MIVGKDMKCPYPEKQPLLTKLCQIAAFLEEIAESIYEDKSKPLREVYTTTENIYARLREWAEGAGIGSPTATQKDRKSVV